MFYFAGGKRESKKEEKEYTGRDPFKGVMVLIEEAPLSNGLSRLVQLTAFAYGYRWRDGSPNSCEVINKSHGLCFSGKMMSIANSDSGTEEVFKNFKTIKYDEFKKLGFLFSLKKGEVYVKRCIETKKIHKVFRHCVPSSVGIKSRAYVPNEEKIEPGFTYHFLDGSTRMYKWFAEMERKDKWLDPYSRLSVTNDFRYGELDDTWHEKFYRLREGEVYFGKTEANNKVYEYLFKAGHEMECRYLMLHSETISGVTSHAYNNSCLKKGKFRLATEEEREQFNKSILQERYISKEELLFQETSNDNVELKKGKWYMATMGDNKIFMNFSHVEGNSCVGHGFDYLGNWCKPGAKFGSKQNWKLISANSESSKGLLNELFTREFNRRYGSDSFMVSTDSSRIVRGKIHAGYSKEIVKFDYAVLQRNRIEIYSEGKWAKDLGCHNVVGSEITIELAPKDRRYRGFGNIYPCKAIVTTAWIHHEGKMVVEDHEGRTWFMEDLVENKISFNKELQRNMTKNSDKSLWPEEICAVNVVDPDTGESEIVLSSGTGVDILSCGIIEPTSEDVMVRNNFVATKKLDENKTKEKRISFKEEKVVSDIPKRKSILEQDKTRIKF